MVDAEIDQSIVGKCYCCFLSAGDKFQVFLFSMKDSTNIDMSFAVVELII